MSLGASMGSEKKTTNSSAQTDPWDEATPLLRKFLGIADAELTGAPIGPTGNQKDAATSLLDIARGGNPHASSIAGLATDLFKTESRAPAVEAGYRDLDTRLKSTADGENLDVTNNPQLQKMLQLVGDNAREAVEGRFASAGRDFSGYEGRAIGKGVADAQTPILFDQFNREQGRTDAAARDLYGANKDTQTTSAQLDEMATKLRTLGIDVGQAGLDASLWGPEKIMALEQAMKDMAPDDLKKWAEILFPAGQLGSQETGTSTSKGSSSKIGGSLRLI